MDKKTFDLSKLKDTLKIMQNDPYQDIYDDVEADLDPEKFNHLDLFRHCIETCHRIFELSEFRYGKAAKNIPTDFLDEIATLYLEVTCWWSEDEISEEDRYAYFTSCVHYPDEKFSIADLSEMIMERNTELIDIDSKNIELWKIKQNYLQKFFGITYNGKSESQAEKYETLRLLKILHDCIRECNVDLGYLLRLSLLKQNSSIPNSYSKAVRRKNNRHCRSLPTAPNSDYRVDFRTIMDLEKYNNSVRSFINSFSEGIVDHILQQLEQPSCRVKRFVCENIYQNVIDNLREIKFSTVSKDEDVKTIQCYAYEHFLMTDIIDEKYSEFYSEIFVVETEENLYSKAEKFLLSNKIDSVSLENLCDFAGKYKKDLAKIVHSNITNFIRGDISRY